MTLTFLRENGMNIECKKYILVSFNCELIVILYNYIIIAYCTNSFFRAQENKFNYYNIQSISKDTFAFTLIDLNNNSTNLNIKSNFTLQNFTFQMYTHLLNNH